MITEKQIVELELPRVLKKMKELEITLASNFGSVLNAEPEISEETNTVPIVGSETESKVELNRKEIITLYEFLYRQYIPYENDDMMKLMRKIREEYDELVTNSDRST